MRGIVWTVLLWWLAAAADAVEPLGAPQLPMPRQLSVYDGLPSNRINALAEDRQGYLWIATRDGLARYDGVGYRVWRVGDGLRDNVIWTVFVDDQDRVWIGTRNAGLAMLDASRREFTYYDRASHAGIGSNDVWSITQTPDGDIWFGTADGGLHRLRDDGGIERFMPVADDPRSLPSPSVTWLRVDGDGRLWIGTHHGVARWTGSGFDRLLQDIKPNAAINVVEPDREGNLWFGTSSSAYVFRRDSGRIEPVPWRDPVLGDAALSMLVEDRRGAHWLDTRSGLGLERAGTVYDVPLYSNTSRGLVRPAWSAALEDREGGLWFASYDAGLWHLPANWRNFTVLRRRLDNPDSPANAFVYGVAPAHDGGLWMVGSGGVLDWLDPDSGRVRHRLSGVCGDLVPHAVREMRDHSVWIGCHGQVARFVPETGEVRRWRHDDAEDPAPDALVVQMAEEADGSVWLASMNGLQLRAPDGRILQRLEAGDRHGFGVNNALQQIAHGPDGALWLATNEGLLMWNAGERRFEPVPGGPDWQVFAFAAAPDDAIWVGGNGMLTSYRWTGVELIAERTVDARQGLPEVAPGGIAIDELGVVWMTSSRGLIRYDPERQRLRVYGVHDGLPSQEFSDYPFEPSARGYIGVGTADGLVLFHPYHVQASDRSPALAIESVQVRRGEDTLSLQPTDAPMVLRHDDRDLHVVARLLSFTDVHAHRYRYRLDGYDPEWVEVGSSGERLFPSLGHGNYVLEVQARTADEEWSPLQRLEFIVQEPWWRTPWAILAWTACSLVLLVLLAWRYRERLRRRHAWQLAEQKRELAEQASLAKTRFLATLGHEVRTPMTGVLGMSELLAGTGLDVRQRGYVESIRRAGEHLLRLVNDALDLARIEADRLELDLQPFDLPALIREMAAFCAPQAEQRGLTLRCAIAEGVPHWVLGDAGRVRQILLNLLGNAVKFTEHGSVALEAAPLQPAGVRLTVSDTGPGLNEEQKRRLFRRFEQAEGARTSARYGGSGLGLAISQELASAMGGRIGIDSAPGEGTRFIVELPLATVAAPADAAPREGDVVPDGLSLLLVEDDATIAQVMAGLLEAQGHRVTHVAHGLAALSESAARAFDAALLDLDLPGVDGLTLASLMREKGFTAPLIAVTARADGDAEAAALRAGFDAFLRKPVTGAMLERVLSETLGDGAERA